MENKLKKYTGTCHCGAVRFEVEFDFVKGSGSRCNCTICKKLGVTGGLVKPAMFALVAGEDCLGAYQWGAKISTRYFCKRCGVYCFGKGHLEMLGGDFVSVNLNTLDHVDLDEGAVVYWDGRHDNWKAGPRKTPWPVHA